jgi:dTDP-glucose pyrophosphorylase
MKGRIAAAGLTTRLQERTEQLIKTPLSLGGAPLPGNLLNQIERAGIRQSWATAGNGPAATSSARRAFPGLSRRGPAGGMR